MFINIGGTSTDLETISGVGVRRQLGITGWYLIDFQNGNISNQATISMTSTSRLTVAMVQQGGGFSMSAIFSNFTEVPDVPSAVYSSEPGCTKKDGTLSTTPGFAPYQWFFNGIPIAGATSNTYLATNTGNYSVSSTLACGAAVASVPILVTLCNDVAMTKIASNMAPAFGSSITFYVSARNSGPSNATGVSV